MALSKNKTGIMAAISAAAESSAAGERAQPTLPRGTIGSVRAGLGGIQSIDTNLIISWGPQDRLELTAVNSGEEEAAEVQSLAESIRTAGQQVPVLLRPAAGKDGHFEVIYGRRRILACKMLEQPVKALIRTLDDGEALMAKGLENANRTDLSYYERARFAEAILAQGFSRAEVIQALSISKNTLSQMERITRLIPAEAGDLIGAAPNSGRPKWMALAAGFEARKTTVSQVQAVLNRMEPGSTSDERLDAQVKDIAKRGARPAQTQVRAPVPGVEVKSGQGALTVSVKRKGESAAFAEWLDANMDGLMKSAFSQFKGETGKG